MAGLVIFIFHSIHVGGIFLLNGLIYCNFSHKCGTKLLKELKLVPYNEVVFKALNACRIPEYSPALSA